MFSNRSSQFADQETTCLLLLKELQIIWDEIGESDSQRDAMLLEIEQKCLELYKKKVDESKQYRSQISQEIADFETEIAAICMAMGEKPFPFELKSCGNLKKGRETTASQLEDMRRLKIEREKQFSEVLHQLQNISNELHGCMVVNANLDEKILSLKRLEELRSHLVKLQNEKACRQKKVSDHLNTLSSLCSILGLDVKDKICEICPTMANSSVTKDVSDHTMNNLTSEVQSLREIKIQRMQKLQSLAAELLKMWNMMETPVEEQQKFYNITCKIAAFESEFTEPKMLSIDSIIYVEREVERFQQLKSTKIEEVLLRKKLELEEICRSTHLTTQVVFSETVNCESPLEQIEHQITKTKEEALSRKEILEKVEKWLAVSKEESWLEEYNRDDNRYNAGRGAHLALKRAEKARVLLSKIPGMIDALILKVTAWEKERGLEFLYEGSRLLMMLEDYSMLMQEKENEKQRQRDQRRLQGQLMTEHETLFGTKSSPSKSGKKASRCSIGFPSIRKSSIGGAMLQDPRHALLQKSNKKGSIANHEGSILRNKNSCHATQLSDTYAGRKDTSKISGHSMKTSMCSAEKEIQIQTPFTRKPLSPVFPSVVSKANINSQDDHKKIQKMQQKSQMLTRIPPSKPVIVGDEENRTPKNMGLPIPTTPLTSFPMFTATTPETPTSYSSSIVAAKNAQPLEYSFEEARAGFILPKTYAN
ncbi:PREDICTED: 65-kDa microtubule-associated protein 3-like isoform X1 [Lupinus angustifolius]|uniref:65-kDa microtubule-associated protein 3-like isoform X1 n=1 Tax=Lupinus angustifolius TaxID=3871 RepID=UPI00092F1C98|nr:PREDICTED: 65-kDa microtubule-associated protein 3-like isoform X1 [Lupinus angustifolius]